ncbi:MAG: alpha/beta fold hydrolase [Candidatus Binatia bacterium]
MTKRSVTLLVLVVVAVVAAVGQLSGNQPERDAVAAAERELGIELESRRVDVGEVTLHVVSAGPADGPLVVLLHGFPEFWYAWRGPLAALATAGFRVAVPDQRGYDLSDKPSGIDAYRVERLAADVAGLVHALGRESAFLAAHDWGGGVAWRVVIDHPERVKKLVIIDTPHPQAGIGFESAEERIDWYRTFIQLPWIPEWTARAGNWWLLAKTLRDTSRPGTFPDATLDLFRSAWDRDGAFSTMANWYRANRAAPPAEPRWRVATPTLVLLAPDDAFIPTDLSRRSLLFLEQGGALELETGTHWVIQEQPDEVGRILVDFFSAAPVGPVEERP